MKRAIRILLWSLAAVLLVVALYYINIAFPLWTKVARGRSDTVVEEYLRTHDVRKLQIGAGLRDLEGWLNTDIEPRLGQAFLDASQRFPLPDGSMHYVFNEHVIEHLTYEQGLSMLQECRRVLAPGGKVRIATPNLLRFVELLQKDKGPELRDYMDGKLGWHNWPRARTPECFILNLQLREFGHQFVYDPETLKQSLTAAGFTSISEFALGESDDPNLRQVEYRQQPKFAKLSAFETMIFQAARP